MVLPGTGYEVAIERPRCLLPHERGAAKLRRQDLLREKEIVKRAKGQASSSSSARAPRASMSGWGNRGPGHF